MFSLFSLFFCGGCHSGRCVNLGWCLCAVMIFVAEISADVATGEVRGEGKKGDGRRERSGEQLSGHIHLTKTKQMKIPLDRQGASRQRTTEERKTENKDLTRGPNNLWISQFRTVPL